MKLTKRKGFNFFRSYYDVYNELSDKDKLSFMDALLDRQFMGVKPTDLKGMAKFAYISQTHSIDSQVKGYEDKTKTKLSNTPTEGGTDAPTLGGKTTPTLQVEGEEKGEEKEQLKQIESLYDLYPTKCPVNNSTTGKSKTNKDKIKTLLKVTTEEHLKYTINRYKDECIKDKRYMKNFATFLNNLPDYEKEVDPNALDEKYIYYQWMNDPSVMARRVLKTEADKMFEGQAMGGYKPKFLKSIKNKKATWS